MTKHLVIPDTQVKPEHSVKHLRWAGKYAAEKKPDVIIHIGDHWDMPSLSSYDVGKRSFEGGLSFPQLTLPYLGDKHHEDQATVALNIRRSINTH